MKYHINREENKTLYLQLYEQIRSDIVNNVYPYGTKLPSKRIIAEETGISVISVEHAYSLLNDEGYIESRTRSGYFVIYRNCDFQTVSDTSSGVTAQHNVHSATTNFPYTVLAKTMRRVLSDYAEDILVKSPNHGCAELRHAICSYLARSNGISVRPEQVIIGSGAEYLYSLIIQLLGNNRIYALENPSYDKIQKVYRANNVKCVMLKLGKDGIRTCELKATSATVLHITPFNSFPSGITATASKRREYIQWAENRNGYIIEDNYDSELTVSKKNEDSVFSLSDGRSVIYLNTFSRTIAPSIRIGYMILPESLLDDFKRKLGFYSCTVPVFEQYVLAELLKHGDYERHINRVRRQKRKLLQAKSDFKK